jgi:hypothetical protein
MMVPTVVPARLRRLPGFLRPRAASGTWTVHATVHEPLPLLLAFVAHYQALGATEVWLALDEPQADQVAVLRAIPGVRLTLCTRAYWLRQRGYRPALHVVRQAVNASRAYFRCRNAWFFECDADEFLWPEGEFAGLLADQESDTLFVRIPMAERFQARDNPPKSIFDGLFRLPLRRQGALLSQVYGDLAPMLGAGLSGHFHGKAATRTGLITNIWVHHPIPIRTKPSFPAVRAMLATAPWLRSARLLHFDGMTPFHWRLKLLRKILVGSTPVDQALIHNVDKRGVARQAQIAAAFGARQDVAALQALDGLYTLPQAAIGKLRAAGGILDISPDIAGLALQRFGHLRPDFSIAGFDRDLATRFADSIARLGLTVPHAAAA